MKRLSLVFPVRVFLMEG